MQTNVLQYFEQGALANFPDKIAVVDHDRRYTFAELARFAKNGASLILQRTTQFNQPIAVYLPKNAEAIIADLGILYSGNCYANLDIKSPPERLKAILNNLEAVLIITIAKHAILLREIGVKDEQLLMIDTAITSESIDHHATLQDRLNSIIDTDPVYIMYTSGSTGVPKGVVIPHRGIIDYIDWAKNCYAISASDTIGSQAPFFFDNSTLDLYLCFSCGATLDLIPEELFAFPVKLINYLKEAGVTLIFWVPSIMANIATMRIFEKVDLPPLSKILFAGEVMLTRTLNYWRRYFPKALFSNLYGPTEITVDCTYFIVDRELADDEKLPIGIPCRNSDILILNESNQPAQGEEPGELCVRGSSLAMGYWNNPERTAQAFVQNPLNPHYPERIYRTGDLVNRNARGEILYIGRKDFQIKHLGYRIELGEVEHAVLQLKGIKNACVLYQPERKEITLFFESDQDWSSANLREQLGVFLPKYMLPTVLHRLDELPKNPSGKIDRKTLSDRLTSKPI